MRLGLAISMSSSAPASCNACSRASSADAPLEPLLAKVSQMILSTNSNARIVADSIRLTNINSQAIDLEARLTADSLRLAVDTADLAAFKQKVQADSTAINNQFLTVSSKILTDSLAQATQITNSNARIVADSIRLTNINSQAIDLEARLTADSLRLVADTADLAAFKQKVQTDSSSTRSKILTDSTALALEISKNAQDVIDSTAAVRAALVDSTSVLRALISGSGDGDSLWNHIVTDVIELNGNYISNDGDAEGILVDNDGKIGLGTAPLSTSTVAINEDSEEDALNVIQSSSQSQRYAVKAEVRAYDRLFLDEAPDSHKEKDYMDFINPNSLEIINAFVEPSLQTAKIGERFQFQRLGYFNVDDDATSENLVFNKTVGLRDSWAKK